MIALTDRISVSLYLPAPSLPTLVLWSAAKFFKKWNFSCPSTLTFRCAANKTSPVAGDFLLFARADVIREQMFVFRFFCLAGSCGPLSLEGSSPGPSKGEIQWKIEINSRWSGQEKFISFLCCCCCRQLQRRRLGKKKKNQLLLTGRSRKGIRDAQRQRFYFCRCALVRCSAAEGDTQVKRNKTRRMWIFVCRRIASSPSSSCCRARPDFSCSENVGATSDVLPVPVTAAFAYWHSSRSGMIRAHRPIGPINKRAARCCATPGRSAAPKKRPADGKRTLTDVDEVISEVIWSGAKCGPLSVTSADSLIRRIVVSGRRLVRSRWA